MMAPRTQNATTRPSRAARCCTALSAAVPLADSQPIMSAIPRSPALRGRPSPRVRRSSTRNQADEIAETDCDQDCRERVAGYGGFELAGHCLALLAGFRR